MNIRILISLFFALCLFQTVNGQNFFKQDSISPFIIEHNDTMRVDILPEAHIFPIYTFHNDKERQAYSRLVRDVTIAYPYAKTVAASIIETYEYMQTLPTEKAKQKQLEAVQKYIMEEYKPKLKRMTMNQGRILIKLIYRECHVSTYQIVKSLVGSFRAGLYQSFAKLFGNSLKEEYDPKGKDAQIEAIVIQIEEGTLDYYYDKNYHSYNYW